MKPPANVNVLNKRCEAIAGDVTASLRLRRVVAAIIVGQMLPPSAIKGGTGLKLRLGHDRSRFSQDLDVARRDGLIQFVDGFQARLTQGWGGFSGRLVELEPARPKGVPAEYIMRPYDVKLEYKGRSWITVLVEVGHDELGDTERPEKLIAQDLVALFESLGLQNPGPLAVVQVTHQIAQKIHALTAPDSQRAHDLVDLQLLITSGVEIGVLVETVKRLFDYRRSHEWPPTVTPATDGTWASLYREAAVGLPVLETVDSAVAWANNLINTLNLVLQAKP
ncbi:MAG TPA: nucleotidyl transferase AbiEii/AbiGii toxin family protein [Candidatus Nanopelagicaceae bacterium]|nr:nucleotidyl transferase AbiEii/AbiGii toxin family protein [Candidatus Nanopelagicaceae bacterium]